MTISSAQMRLRGLHAAIRRLPIEPDEHVA